MATNSGGRREIPAPKKAEAATPGSLPMVTTIKSNGIGIEESPAMKQRASSGKKGRRKARKKNHGPAFLTNSSARARFSSGTNRSTSGRPNLRERIIAPADPSTVPTML